MGPEPWLQLQQPSYVNQVHQLLNEILLLYYEKLIFSSSCIRCQTPLKKWGVSHVYHCVAFSVWKGLGTDETSSWILAAQQSWVLFVTFHDAPNVFSWWKVSTVGSSVQLFYYEAMLLSQMRYVVWHCVAEICKAFSKKGLIWMGAYVALKPAPTSSTYNFKLFSELQNSFPFASVHCGWGWFIFWTIFTYGFFFARQSFNLH